VQTTDLLLHRLHVVEKPLARETQEVEAEFRILEIELAHLVIGDAQHFAGLQAFEGLRACVGRGHEAHLADDLALKQLDVDLLQAEATGDREEHAVGNVALGEENFSCRRLAAGHEGLEPFHGKVALRGLLYALDQAEHLIQAHAVDRQQDQIGHDARDIAQEGGDDQGADVRPDPDAAQRDDRLHRAARDGKSRPEPADCLNPCHEDSPAVFAYRYVI